MINELINSIKKHEGFRGMPYKDSLGYQTIGYGTKLPITELEAEFLLRNRIINFIEELESKIPFVTDLPDNIQLVLFEMAYQLGVPKLMKFKKMLKAVKNKDWNGMIREMRDSKWYKQTPNRVEELIERVKNGL